MKKIPLILLLMACLGYCDARSQCAIYQEEGTGIWGAKWDDGKPPYASMDKIKEAAKKACEDFGGKNCQLFVSGYQIGWWVVVRGRARRGNEEGYLLRVMLFKTENTPEAKEAAEKAAIKEFGEKEGTIPETAQVFSWYVPGRE